MLNFFSALSFLTIIQTPKQASWDDGKKILYFPLVGLLIGVLLYGVDRFLSVYSYREIRAVLDVLFLAVITGGLHLDGLADSADGLFSHKGREKALDIMKDPRIGSMGTIALVFCLLMKTAGIMRIDGESGWVWLLTAPALARSAQAIGLVFMDNARGNDGMGAPFFQKGNYRVLSLCVLPIGLPFFIDIKMGLLILGLFVFSTATLFRYFRARIGGMTGDTFGAASEVVETTLLVAGGLAGMPPHAL